jgi:N-methylhydantoinase A
MKWLGIDVGGTFTDLVFYERKRGRLIVDKVPSTPVDPSQGVHAGTARLDFDLADIAMLVHGTTVATTTIIERRARAPRC